MVTAASERLREETNLLAGGYGLVMAENGEKVKRLKRANRGGGTIHGLVVTSFPIPDTGTQTSADKFLDDSGVENVHRAIGGDMTNRVVFGARPCRNDRKRTRHSWSAWVLQVPLRAAVPIVFGPLNWFGGNQSRVQFELRVKLLFDGPNRTMDKMGVGSS
jgi:hypothetical protein